MRNEIGMNIRKTICVMFSEKVEEKLNQSIWRNVETQTQYIIWLKIKREIKNIAIPLFSKEGSNLF